jgi:rhamnogalacturonyl hydrolase YesR
VKWDRALGWYVIAIVDVLDHLPSSHPGFSILVSILQENVAGLQKAVDAESKMWWLVMSQPGREKNYIESSGTALFIYAILKGVRMGYLGSEYTSLATQAYEAMTERFVTTNADGGIDWAGTVSVGSLSGKGDYDVSSNSLHGRLSEYS